MTPESMNRRPITTGAVGYALVAGAERKCRVIDLGCDQIAVTPLDGARLAADGPGYAWVPANGFYLTEAR